MFVFLLSTLADFGFGLWIEGAPPRSKRWLVAVSVGLNLAVLAYFKYSNFFVAQFNHALAGLGLSVVPWIQVALPIGISFFTFHKITYIVDVYRKTKPALRNPIDFALYLALFPQLIAGPIVRFHEISGQLTGRVESAELLREGILRFCWGLAKKVLIANSCGEVADAVFSTDIGELGTTSTWLGVAAYTLQIYFDFSGYTDMALGLGLMFGFRLPENFDRPYSAISITDFWRRWHMSLTRFFRDYVYIPLGGNRRGDLRTYLNLMLVFVLCGIWHGANWTFLAWGLYHGFWLIAERMSGIGRSEATTPSLIRRVSTLAIIMVGWVLFRSPNLTHAAGMLLAMLTPKALPTPLAVELALNWHNLVVLAVGASALFLPVSFSGHRVLTSPAPYRWSTARTVCLAFLVLWSIVTLASTTYNPFLYFQF